MPLTLTPEEYLDDVHSRSSNLQDSISDAYLLIWMSRLAMIICSAGLLITLSDGKIPTITGPLLVAFFVFYVIYLDGLKGKCGWYNVLSKTPLVRSADETFLTGFNIRIRRTDIGEYHQLILLDKDDMVILTNISPYMQHRLVKRLKESCKDKPIGQYESANITLERNRIGESK